MLKLQTLTCETTKVNPKNSIRPISDLLRFMMWVASFMAVRQEIASSLMDPTNTFPFAPRGTLNLAATSNVSLEPAWLLLTPLFTPFSGNLFGRGC